MDFRELDRHIRSVEEQNRAYAQALTDYAQQLVEEAHRQAVASRGEVSHSLPTKKPVAHGVLPVSIGVRLASPLGMRARQPEASLFIGLRQVEDSVEIRLSNDDGFVHYPTIPDAVAALFQAMANSILANTPANSLSDLTG